MSVQIQPLFEPIVLTSGLTTLFTASAATRIDKITVQNGDTATRMVNLYWVPSGAMAASANQIVNAVPVSPTQSVDLWPIMGHTLAAGDALVANADAPSVVNIFGSGIVVA